MAAITSAIIVGAAVAAASTVAWGVVAGVAMFALQKSMQPDLPETSDLDSNLLVTKYGKDGKVPVVYGTRRVGGVVIFDDIVSSRKRLLVIALSQGEVESIEDIRIDDTPITSSKFNGYVHYATRLGTEDQTAIPLITQHYSGSESQPWTLNHRCKGVALLAVELQRDMQGEKVSPNPAITAVVKGVKVGHPNLPTKPDGSYQKLYSENPVLHAYDYMTNPIYGLGAAENDCNVQRLLEDIAYCEQTRVVNGETIPMYRNNMVVNQDNDIKTNVQRIMDQCLGTVIQYGNKFELVADKPTNAVQHITEDEILDGISFSNGSGSKTYNVIHGRFTNPKADWNSDTVVLKNDDLYVQDDNVESLKEISFHGCTNKLECHVLSSAALMKSRRQDSVSFKTNLATEYLRVWDVVELSSDVMGFDKELFRINEIVHNPDGTNNISATIYTPEMYTYLGDLTGFVDNVYTPNKSKFFDIDPPQNFAFEQLSFNDDGSGRLSWVHPDSFNADRYIIDYKLSSEASTEYVQLAETQGTSYVVTNMKASSYDFRIRAVSLFGLRSDFAYVTSAVIENFITMPPVENLRSITGTSTFNKSDCTIVWDEVTEQDIQAANTYTSAQGQENVGAYLRNYEIQVHDGYSLLLLNTFVSTTNQFTYSFEQNGIDNGGTPVRKLMFKVAAVSKRGFKSTQRQKTLTNNQQTTVVVNPSVEGQAISISVQIPQVDDYQGTEIHVSDSSGFVPSGSTLVGEITNADQFVHVVPDTDKTYYVRCGSYDVFGKDSIAYSVEQSVTSFQFNVPVPDLNYIDTALVPKTDVNGRVTGLGAIEDSAGPFSPLTLVSNSLQIWNDLDSSVVPFSVQDNQVYIDSALIKDASIEAAQISSINANNITTGTLNASRIGANTIDATKIDSRDLTIKDSGGTVIFGSGAQFDGSTYIQNGTIDGAKIANAAITSAQIADASINTAKILDASVSTLKIQDQAVTIPSSAYTSGSTGYIIGSWVTCQTVSYTGTGNPTSIIASLKAWMNGNESEGEIGFCNVRILVNGSSVYLNNDAVTSIGSHKYATFTVALRSTPSAGVVTVQLQAQGASGGADLKVSNRSLLVTETKK